jgi:spore maturation protein CgeB
MLKRVLFAGYMGSGSTCVPRMETLREFGLDVSVLDVTPMYENPLRLMNALSLRFNLTPPVIRMNARLLKHAKANPADVAWIEKGNWIFPSTLRRLRRYARNIVHYNTDDIFGKQSWFWLHRLGIPEYDVYLTTNRFNILEIRERYPVHAFRAGMGYEQGFHRPSRNGRADPQCDVVFAGHWEPHTEGYVNALAAAGIDVRVWGPHWNKARNRAWHKATFLDRERYIQTMASAKIALCSLSRRNRNESTGRSFEIPAIGVCLLAPRTAEHEYLYRDGMEAVLFDDEIDLVKKARSLLDDFDLRERIAHAGHDRCMKAGLSWGDHLRREWPLVERFLLQGARDFRTDDDLPFWPGYREGQAWAKK